MDVKTDIARAREYYDAENFSRAKRLCERILSTDEKNAEAWMILGTIEMRRARYAFAIPPLEKSVELAPDNVEALGKLAFAYQQERHIRKALEAYLAVLEKDPKNYEALYGAGMCQTILGDFTAAQEHLEKAIGISNHLMEPYRLLVDFTAKGEDPELLKELEALADTVKNARPVEQAQWHYAMANAYEKQGKPDKFIEHLEKANALQATNDRKWFVAHRFMLDAAKEIFADQAFQAVTPESEKKFTPIFIVGMPRSGSTMLEQILATHPDVYGADELLYIRRFFIEDMSRHMGVPYPLFLEKLTEDDLIGMARRYQETVETLANGQPFITDKMVGNIFFVGLIKKVMPWAKVIHIKRHPYDMALSIYSRHFNVSAGFLNNLEEMADYFRCHHEASQLWQKACPDFIHEVRYESLVDNLEDESRKILDFCGLDWDPSVLEFHKAKRSVFTHSSTQVREKVYSTSVGKWQKHAQMLAPFISRIDDLMEDYGYAEEPKAG